MARPTATPTDPRRVTVAIALLVASSVVLLPGGFDRWTFPKLALAVIAATVALWAPPAGRLPRWAPALAGAWGVILVVAALAGPDPLAQLVGRWPRYEGLFAVAAAVLLLVAGARLFGPAAPASRWRSLAIALSLAAWATGGLAALETLGVRPIPSDLDRPGSLLGNASSLGTWAVVVVVLLAGHLARRVLAGERWARSDDLVLSGVVAALLALVLSASRIAIATAVAVGVGALAVVLVRRARRSRAVALAITGALALVVVAALVIPGTGSRFATSGPLLSDRETLWSASLDLVAAHPLVGVGAGGFADAVAAHRDATWWSVIDPGVTMDSAHDLALDAAATGGIPLLVVLLAALVLVAVAAWRGRRRPEVVVAALAAGAGVATWTTAFPTSGTAPLVLVLVAAVAVRETTPARALLIRAGRVGAAVLAAVLVVAALAEWPLHSLATGRDAASVRAAFATAQGMRPWDPEIVLLQAQVLTAHAANGGDAGAALVAAQEAVRARPAAIVGAKALAAAQQFAGRLDEAAATLDALDARAPGDPQVLARWGLVEAQRGDLAAARPLLERAVELAPRDRTSWQALGYVYESTGDAVGLARVGAALAALDRGETP